MLEDRQEKPLRPPNAPTQTTGLPITVSVPQVNTILTVTVHPWPTGVEFPNIGLAGLTVQPGGMGSWSGMNVYVAADENTITIGEGNSGIQLLSTNNLPPPTLATGTLTFATNSPKPTSSAEVTPTASEPAASVNSNTGTSFSSAAPQPSESQSTHGNGLSKGGIAGIAVGCVLVGIFVAALVGWFCLRRSRERRLPGDHEGSAMAFLHREKIPAVKTQAMEDGSPVFPNIDSDLPQPLEDRAISGEINKLETSIKNHVQSFYHTSRVSPGVLDMDDLQALGTDLPISIGTLSTLLDNSHTREIALRFCIAWTMISRMDLHKDPSISFLPPEIVQSFRGMSDANQKLQTKWRATTGDLMRSTYGQNTIHASDPRIPSIHDACGILDPTLQPYVDSRVNNDERRRNLEEIFKRAACFAFTLFAQPSTWTFDWKEEQGVKSGSLCIFPALLQTADEAGENIRPPRQLSEAVVRKLDS